MDPETTPPTDSSAGNQPPADAGDAGSGNAGDQGGASSTAEQFAAERSALQSEARRYQSEADKAKADRDRLQAQLDALENPAPTDEPTPGLTLEQVRAASFAAQRIIAAEASLREQYPSADASIYDRIDQFESVEALSAAVEASHSRKESEAKALRDKIEDEVRREFAEKHGIELGPPEPVDSTPTGDPTVEQLGRMTQPELDALEKARPGLIAKVMGLPDMGTGWSG